MKDNKYSAILVVDDEPSLCWGLERLLREDGHEVLTASSAEAGLKLAKSHRVSLVLLDIRLPGEDGLSALPKFLAATDNAPVVVMTAFGDLETAVTAMQRGASDYLTKPFPLEQAARTCRQALLGGTAVAAALSETRSPGIAKLIGNSPAMQTVFRQIAMVADSSLSVLITGETGTGKELVAAAIHRHSHRHAKPYLSIAPVALSEALFESELFGHVRGAFTGANEDRQGLFELANGGTVLLDEIGDLPIAAQAKLLRVIEQQEYTRVGDVRPRDCDVRIIAATHRDLAEAVRNERFREDLMYRLSAIRIQLPPLRDRAEDIPMLCEHFLALIGHPVAQQPLGNDVIALLQRRPWYGNVRELRHAVEHAAVFARNRRFDLSDFPEPISQPPELFSTASEQLRSATSLWAQQQLESSVPESTSIYDRFLAATEPVMLRIILQNCGGNRAAAADRLGLHRATLRQRLRKYGIDE